MQAKDGDAIGAEGKNSNGFGYLLEAASGLSRFAAGIEQIIAVNGKIVGVRGDAGVILVGRPTALCYLSDQQRNCQDQGLCKKRLFEVHILSSHKAASSGQVARLLRGT